MTRGDSESDNDAGFDYEDSNSHCDADCECGCRLPKDIIVPVRMTENEAKCVLSTYPRNLTVAEYRCVLTQLIDTGFNINENESSLLLNAFRYSDLAVVELLFDFGAKINGPEKLYKTHSDDEPDARISVFHENLSYTLEAALLRHILSETPKNQAVIFEAIKRRNFRLNTFNDNMSNYDQDFAKDFAKLCVLTQTFPSNRPTTFVMRECHLAGLTHPDYQDVLDMLSEVSSDRDYWKKTCTDLSEKIDACITVANDINITIEQ